jgi:hypothetical protein
MKGAPGIPGRALSDPDLPYCWTAERNIVMRKAHTTHGCRNFHASLHCFAAAPGHIVE